MQSAKRFKHLKIVAWLIVGLGIAGLVILPRLAAGFPKLEIPPGPPPIPLTPEETAAFERMDEIAQSAFDFIYHLVHFWVWFYPSACLLVGALILSRRFYTLSVLGAALVCTGVFPVGAALGGWALFLLRSQETRKHFQQQTELKESDFLA